MSSRANDADGEPAKRCQTIGCEQDSRCRQPRAQEAPLAAAAAASVACALPARRVPPTAQTARVCRRSSRLLGESGASRFGGSDKPPNDKSNQITLIFLRLHYSPPVYQLSFTAAAAAGRRRALATVEAPPAFRRTGLTLCEKFRPLFAVCNMLQPTDSRRREWECGESIV